MPRHRRACARTTWSASSSGTPPVWCRSSSQPDLVRSRSLPTSTDRAHMLRRVASGLLACALALLGLVALTAAPAPAHAAPAPAPARLAPVVVVAVPDLRWTD